MLFYPLPMESNAPESGKESSWSLAVVVALALPVLYLLSIGPAATMVNRYPALEEPLTIFYAPIIYLTENTPLGDIMIRYIELWI